MNLTKLTYEEIRRLESRVGNIENFKVRHKTGPASRLDVYKDIDSYDKDIYVDTKEGSPYPEHTGETLY